MGRKKGSKNRPKQPQSPIITPIEQPAIVFTTLRTKPLAELTAADIPRGLEPEDVATDYAPEPEPTPEPIVQEPPIPLMQERSGAFAANMGWLSENLEAFNGLWVALFDGRLLVSGATRDDLEQGIVGYADPMMVHMGVDYKQHGTQ